MAVTEIDFISFKVKLSNPQNAFKKIIEVVAAMTKKYDMEHNKNFLRNIHDKNYIEEEISWCACLVANQEYPDDQEFLIKLYDNLMRQSIPESWKPGKKDHLLFWNNLFRVDALVSLDESTTIEFECRKCQSEFGEKINDYRYINTYVPNFWKLLNKHFAGEIVVGIEAKAETLMSISLYQYPKDSLEKLQLNSKNMETFRDILNKLECVNERIDEAAINGFLEMIKNK